MPRGDDGRPSPADTPGVHDKRSDGMGNTVSQRAVAPVAVGSIVLATVLAAVGTWGGGDEQGTREFLVVCAIIAVAAAVVFGWVVPRGLQREAAGATAVTLSILGLLAVLAFWAGLTPILAGGGALLGWAGRDADRGRGMSRAAIGIGALALLGYFAIYLTDAIF
jgi:hypothetical protein